MLVTKVCLFDLDLSQVEDDILGRGGDIHGWDHSGVGGLGRGSIHGGSGMGNIHIGIRDRVITFF